MTMFKKEEEIILVAKKEDLFSGNSLEFQGVMTDQNVVDQIINRLNLCYESMRRGSREEVDVSVSENAELNFDYKQPIPYIVIKRGDQFFVTERLEGGGESRLHGKLSMGVGGHMNPLGHSLEFSEVLKINTQRELEEELDITGEIKINAIGLVNDDSEEVSRVHIGILGIIELELDDEVTVRETEQLAGQWMTIKELKEEKSYSRLENWSKTIVGIL